LSLISNGIIGFDCGPGNALMDYWTKHSLGKAYDDGGQWAEQGQPIEKLVNSMLADQYFAKRAPKSTGRDLFNPTWLKHHLEQTGSSKANPQDVQACLLIHTAQSIAKALKEKPPQTKRLLICGGGIKNTALINSLKRICSWIPSAGFQSTATEGIDPQAVEAAAFAWLAWAHKEKQPANMPAVTGARGLRLLGACYPA
ncbi:MAG: anhydro-N-acetylmuramic acid kinase, partial [Polynucleobacter victoriensis]